MSVEGVLVEYENTTDNEVYTNSGLLLSDKYVLITGNVLTPYLKQFTLNSWLGKLQPGLLHYNVFPTENKPLLRVITNGDNLKFRNAYVIATFVCRNILNSSQKYLKDWAIDFEDRVHQIKEILALFFILKIENDLDKLEIDLKQSELSNKGHLNHVKDENNSMCHNLKYELNTILCELLENARKYELLIGDVVFIESTPFGNRAFVNSYSQGVVSNIIGENACFLLTDCPSAPGSEGSPIFIKTKHKDKTAIGIVISCLNWWKGEWVGLTLCTNLVPLLSQLLKINFKKSNVIENPTGSNISISKELQDTFTKTLVQIVSGAGWGTGILISKNKGIFLTNSHVIESANRIVVYWKNQPIKASLIYQTPNSDVYDLAVLKCDINFIRKSEMTQATISLKLADVGEEVYAAGYSLLSKDLKPSPLLTKGHISQVHKSMIKTTCTILPGASGGAIFRPNGELIGIVVSNVKMNDIGVIYPRVNMSIPIAAVYPIIKKFVQTEDTEHLKLLHSKDVSTYRPWNFFSGKL